MISKARRRRRKMIARKPRRVAGAALVLASAALAASALTLERAPGLIVPAKEVVPAKRSLLPAPAIVRAASMEEAERAIRKGNFLPGMAGVAGMFGGAVIDPDLVFLSQFDGADAATSATDIALGGGGNPHTITFNGSAQLDTAQAMFGASSLLPNGSNVSIADHADFNFGTNDFTIALWFRTTTVANAYRFVFDKRATSGAITSVLIGQSASNGAQLRCWISSNGSTWDIASEWVMGSIAVDTWYHLELARGGATFYPFLDGTLATTFTSSAAVHNTTAAVRFGGDSDGFSLSGWIDGPGIWNGRALHTASFTPPAAPYSPYLA